MPTDAPSRPLALVANAADGTISAYRLTGDGVASRLAVSAVARHASPESADAARLTAADFYGAHHLPRVHALAETVASGETA